METTRQKCVPTPGVHSLGIALRPARDALTRLRRASPDVIYPTMDGQAHDNLAAAAAAAAAAPAEGGAEPAGVRPAVNHTPNWDLDASSSDEDSEVESVEDEAFKSGKHARTLLDAYKDCFVFAEGQNVLELEPAALLQANIYQAGFDYNAQRTRLGTQLMLEAVNDAIDDHVLVGKGAIDSPSTLSGGALLTLLPTPPTDGTLTWTITSMASTPARARAQKPSAPLDSEELEIFGKLTDSLCEGQRLLAGLVLTVQRLFWRPKTHRFRSSGVDLSLVGITYETHNQAIHTWI